MPHQPPAAANKELEKNSSQNPTNIDDLPPDILFAVLRRLDGRSLAAASCASSRLCALSTDPDTWQSLCLSNWPSTSDAKLRRLFRSSHRAFFADAFPFPCAASLESSPPSISSSPRVDQLISAVDLHYKGTPVFSRVVETETSSPWFLGSPFRVDAIGSRNPIVKLPTVTSAELTLSWIVIDTDTRKAVNVSSRRPVSLHRKWSTGEAVVRFAAVVTGSFALLATVTCDEAEGVVKEVSLAGEDSDGVGVSGREVVKVLMEAMAMDRRGGKGEEEVVRRRYEQFVKRKKRRKEMKARREGLVDLCCSGIGAAAFLAFVVLLVFR